MYSIELWKSHFKAIEGHFGTSVTSYFRFIKWLFLLNIPVFLLTLAFVVVPQLLWRYMELDGYTNNDFQAEDILTGSVSFNMFVPVLPASDENVCLSYYSYF